MELHGRTARSPSTWVEVRTPRSFMLDHNALRDHAWRVAGSSRAVGPARGLRRLAQASLRLFVTLHPPAANGPQLQIWRRYIRIRLFHASVWEGVHAEGQRPEYSAHQRRGSSED